MIPTLADIIVFLFRFLAIILALIGLIILGLSIKKKSLRKSSIILLFITAFFIVASYIIAAYASTRSSSDYEKRCDIDPKTGEEICTVTIPENEGKLKVYNLPEVQQLVKKYGKEHIHIKALDINLVKDIEYIKSIHPNFKEQTGCIIVVHAGNEGYVYQEDKKLNIIYKETMKDFLEKTRGVDSDVMAKFYLSLH